MNRAASKGLFISIAIFCLLPIGTSAYLSNINGSLSGGLEVVGSVRQAIRFQVDATETNTWTFTVRIVNNFTFPASIVRLQIYHEIESPTGNFHPDDAVPDSGPFVLSPQGLISGNAADGRYRFEGNGTLTQGKMYWLVAVAGPGDDYAWPDTGSYIENGAQFEGVKVDNGTGWADAFVANTLSLEISAVPVPSHILLSQPIFVGGQIQLSYSTMTAKTYYLQFNTNLVSTNWSNVHTNAGDGTTKTNLVTPSGPQGYYRLLRD